MAQPRFRFIDGDLPSEADAQFWRDVEASERLGSRFKANLFLRELCRSKAWEGASSGVDPRCCEAAERELLRGVSARGFQLSGPDVGPFDAPALANAG